MERDSVVHVLAGEVVGVFAHVERADEDGARRLQPLDQRRVARGGGMLAVDLRAGERRQSSDVEQVLDREWNAREWPERVAPRVSCIKRGGGRLRALLRHCGKGVE